jgi:iron(III) transport system ATP-binding protein
MRARPAATGARATSIRAASAALTYQGVTHRYGAVTAVSNFDLDIAAGEIVSLLGPSGCGKTTLLRLAAGVERPGAGRILIGGREVASNRAFEPPEQRHVGLMFQDYALFPHLTNLANVMFGLKSLPKQQAEREARAALERVGLAKYADAYPHMLSGGEQQRVALARAVAPRPAVLLMDEPFSNLDRRLRDQVRAGTLRVLRDAGITCVIVTHDAEEAMLVADRIALMRAGRLVQEGAPHDLYRAPADLFAARFFCELNEVPAVVRGGPAGGVAECVLGRFPAGDLRDGMAAIVAVRPQGISLRPAGTGIAGELRSRRFLGEVELLELRVNGLSEPLMARVHERVYLAADSTVGIAIDPAEVLVFAASQA